MSRHAQCIARILHNLHDVSSARTDDPCARFPPKPRTPDQSNLTHLGTYISYPQLCINSLSPPSHARHHTALTVPGWTYIGSSDPSSDCDTREGKGRKGYDDAMCKRDRSQEVFKRRDYLTVVRSRLSDSRFRDCGCLFYVLRFTSRRTCSRLVDSSYESARVD